MIDDPGFDLLALPIVHRAMHIALLSHQGAKPHGELYLLHVHRVAWLTEKAGGTPHQIALAWLHDVVEDTPTTLEDIRRLFEDASGMAEDVDAITHRKGEPLDEYLNRCAARPNSTFVKLNADSRDNFRRNHLVEDPGRQERLARKYSRTIDRLSFAP